METMGSLRRTNYCGEEMCIRDRSAAERCRQRRRYRGVCRVGGSIAPEKAPGREQCGVNDASPNRWECARSNLGQHRIIPALRLKHRSGGCGTASALPKCSIIHKVLSALLA